jgi:hypothetical protein
VRELETQLGAFTGIGFRRSSAGSLLGLLSTCDAMRSVGILSWIAPLVALLILGTVLSPFLPHFLGTALIGLRLVVMPGVIALGMFTLSEGILIGAFVVFTILCEILVGTHFDKEKLLILLSILALLPFFKAGVVLGSRRVAKPVWRAILFSTMAVNVVTIALYGDALLGGSVATDVLTRAQRGDEDPLFRFSLGNAIELPALAAMATLASIVALRGRGFAGVCALVANLGAALISQSRMVVLISACPFLWMWRRFGLKALVLIVALVVGLVFLNQDGLAAMWNSIYGRFQGDDYHSAEDRVEILRTVLGHSNVACLGVGNGIGSSVRLMIAAGNGERSVESVALQLYYELGLLRIAVFALLFAYIIHHGGFRVRMRLDLLLMAVQAFLLLPIISYTPLYVFCIGALCVEARRISPGGSADSKDSGWASCPALPKEITSS